MPLEPRENAPEQQATTPPSPRLIVGVGASAGGLEALERFFEQMPERTGMAFAVIQHLAPDFKSLMDELLARRTRIPIRQAENGMLVEPDTIYLMPPSREMIIANGRLLLANRDQNQLLALPINHFFRSLAQDVGQRGVAIVLSGTGRDGSAGVQEVHQSGGYVIAQSSASAAFDGMPTSAVETDAVDVVLAPEEMADALLARMRHLAHPEELTPAKLAAPETGLETIMRKLHEETGIDFELYKPATVARRTERRLALLGIATLDQYAARLEQEPAELGELYKDLLIGVTRFFRDFEAFEIVRRDVLPGLANAVAAGGELRIWITATATGEEAYSMAIVVHEVLEQIGRQDIVPKIFATDVHKASLEKASQGVYPRDALADVSSERRRRFFVENGETYTVVPELRASVVFAPHNLLRDPPFTNVSLISCRNLLIYFELAAQKRVLSLFHFGLITGGVLFLGPSETTGELASDFETLHQHWKLYRKRNAARRGIDVRALFSSKPRAKLTIAGTPHATSTIDRSLLGTYDALLDEFLPPSFLINENRELVHSFGGASQYLKPQDGRMSRDVIDLVEGELKVALTGAVQRAFTQKTAVTYRNLSAGQEGHVVTLTVRPVRSRRSGEFSVLALLERMPDAVTVATPPGKSQELDLSEASRDHLQTLEIELRYAKENLQATIEELETSNEELQATNEEMVAANEELQATNEQLHSLNEELTTLNAEYQRRIAELTELTTDLDHLLASTEVQTLFLDANLAIRRFTLTLARIFQIIPQDVGRRITSFAHSLDYPDLINVLEGVLVDGKGVEEQVQSSTGEWFLMRVLPYYAAGVISGVVLTLVNIDRVKQAEAVARERDAQLTAILKNSPHAVFLKTLDGRYTIVDDSFRSLVTEDPVGRRAEQIFPAAAAVLLVAMDAKAASAGAAEAEIQMLTPAGERTFMVVKFAVRDLSGDVTGVGGIYTDVTRLKEAERAARGAVVERDRFLAILSHELRNPLAAIRNAALMMRRGNKRSPADTGALLDVVERRSSHMTRLLSDLLDVARVTQDKLALESQPVEIDQALRGALEEVRHRSTEKGLSLTFDGEMPSPWVSGDPARLQQVFVNLLVNALNYTPSGGSIHMTSRADGDEVTISVRDTGEGIAPEMTSRVFDMFVQLGESGKAMERGLGVGLTLARRIVELHGGTIVARSEGLGKGSEFLVILKRAARASISPTRPPKALASPEGKTLLLVEDDADNLMALAALMASEGIVVTTATDGPEALALVDKRPFDLILLDVGLPTMTGYELCRRIRDAEHGKRAKIVALTGYGRPEDVRAAVAAGFDAHFTKPADLDQILRLFDDTP